MAKDYLIETISEESLKQISELVKRIESGIEGVIKMNKEFKNLKLPSDISKGFTAVTEETKKSNKVVSDALKLQIKLENSEKAIMQAMSSKGKQLIKNQEIARKLNKETKDQLKTSEKSTAQINKERAARERQVKAESDLRQRLLAQRKKEEAQSERDKIIQAKLGTEYAKLVAKMNKAGEVVQNLTAKKAQGIPLSTREQIELKKSTVQFTRYQKAVLKADASIGRFQRNVGNYKSALGGLTNGLRSFAGAFGLTSGVYLFAGAIKDAFTRVREFDKSMQNLAGILRVSRPDIASVEAEIIKVAGSSVKTSREVAQLAENLVTLGKSQSDVKKLLKPVNDLAIGLETTSGEAAEFLVQTLNAFGASSDEAGKYADVIATIRTSTSLDFQKMRDSFQYLTPISRILNKDLAYTGAVLGILADNGLKAESAGRLLGTAQQKLAKEGKTLAQALDEINDAQKRGIKEVKLLELASNLFGKQAAKVGVILANNTDIIEINSQAIRDNGGALDDLVNEQLKSMDAQLKILDSSYEELILTIENGEGSISQFFSSMVQGATLYLNILTDLEKAQSGVFRATGKGKGIGDYAQYIIPPLASIIKTDYEELIEMQEDFNKINENISANGIGTLEGMYKSLNRTLEFSSHLTEDQKKLYKQQIGVVEEAISAKRDERTALEETAIALGFNKKELGKYADTISLYTDGDLQKFIQANQEAAESVKEGGKELDLQRAKLEKVTFVYQNVIDKLKEIKDANFEAFVRGTVSHEEYVQSAKDVDNAINDIYESLKLTDGAIFEDVDVSGLEKYQALKEKQNKTTQDAINLTRQEAEETEILTEAFGNLESALGIQQGTFDTIFDGITNGFEDAGEAAQAFGELASGAFANIMQASNVRLENEARNLEIEKDTALQFAGDSAAAREEIERRYDERQKAIKEKQAKNDKAQALFNIGIGTAQGIIKTIGSVGFPAAIPLIATIGALGLAQAAVVAATPIPQFKDGVRDFSGGQAILGDGGVSEYVRTPDNRVFRTPATDTLYNLPKGTDVYKNEDEFNKSLNGILGDVGINPLGNAVYGKGVNPVPLVINQNGGGITREEMERVMQKTLAKQATNTTVMDKNGIRTFISKGHSRKEILNNQVTFNSQSV